MITSPFTAVKIPRYSPLLMHHVAPTAVRSLLETAGSLLQTIADCKQTCGNSLLLEHRAFRAGSGRGLRFRPGYNTVGAALHQGCRN